MTDTDRMVVWLRDALEAATRRAEAAAGEAGSAEWEYQPHSLVAMSPPGFMVADVDYFDPAPGKFMADHDPAAVLRRVAAERKLLDDLLAEGHVASDEDTWYACASLKDEDGDPVCADDTRAPGPCDCGRDVRVERRVRLLAEGWGWIEETP